MVGSSAMFIWIKPSVTELFDFIESETRLDLLSC
jgi:hypothetical protein